MKAIEDWAIGRKVKEVPTTDMSPVPRTYPPPIRIW